MFLERIPVRFRLSLSYAVWMALLFLCIGVGIYKLVERNLDQSVDGALIASAKSLRDARKAISYRSPFTQSFLREFFGESYIRPYAQLVDLSGRVSAKTPNVRATLPVTPHATARAERGFATIENISRRSMPPLRLITLPVLHRGKFTGELIQVGAPLDATYRTLRSISLMLWVVLPVGLMISIVVGYLLMAWSLKPVAAVTRTASSLGSEDLDTRLKLPRANDEIRELSLTFNNMMDRLQDAFSRVKRFSGDVSHELRTPLAVMRGEAEFALRRQRSGEEYRQALTVIENEAVNMTGIVEDLLLLARAQSKSVAMNWEKISMKEFIRSLTDSLQAVFEQRDIKLNVQDFGDFNFFGVSGYLNLALRNILLNAAKHSPEHSSVDLVVESRVNDIRIHVRDQGEGIPKESVRYVFDAFYRADTARNRSAGGTGIGLSLAQALVRLHDGKVLVDSALGAGSTFTVVFPFRKECPEKKIANGTSSDQAKSRTASAVLRPLTTE